VSVSFIGGGNQTSRRKSLTCRKLGKCKHPFSKLVGTSTLALQLPVQSVFITTKVVNSNTAHVEVYHPNDNFNDINQSDNEDVYI
jgi:hypothetical protein